MFLVETKKIKEIINNFKTLNINSKSIILQKTCINDIILHEWNIPVLWSEDTDTEVVLQIDEHVINIINTCDIIWIDLETISGPGISYMYDRTESMSWETFFPQISCILCIFDLSILPDEPVNIEITHKGFEISWEKFSRTYPTLKLFNNVTIQVNGVFLKEVFSQHTGKCAVVYAQQDYPFCLEFSGGERVYIAPCLNSELDG